MRIVEHDHRSGVSAVGPALLTALRESLATVRFRVHTNCAKTLRSAILERLGHDGWSDKVHISAKRKLTITAMHGKTALCLQTGNMARFYADLLKLQAQFLDESIRSAVYLLPTRSCANIMGQNIANYERLSAELSQEFQRVITVPMVIIGFESEVS